METIQMIRREATHSLANAPEGSMRAEMKNGKYPQYYWIHDWERKVVKKGHFIRKKDLNIARALAQKEYDQLILRKVDEVEAELRKIDIVEANRRCLIDVWTRLPEAKKRLVTPYILPEEEYIARWKASFETGGNTYPFGSGYTTENDETVRSKSEKIIADKLRSMGIPYVYEPMLNLKGHRLFPDFVLLDIATGDTCIYEHFGMMDDPEYCRSALEKIDLYADNGYILGDKLLVSFESGLKGINIKQLEAMLKTKFVTKVGPKGHLDTPND